MLVKEDYGALLINPPAYTDAVEMPLIQQSDDQRRFTLIEIQLGDLNNKLNDLVEENIILKGENADLKSIVEDLQTKHIESGSASFFEGNIMHFTFPQSFSSIPKVVVSLQNIDPRGTTRFDLWVNNITLEGFDVGVSTGEDSPEWYIAIVWVAYLN